MTTVAIVPAYGREDRIAATVTALAAVEGVDEVVVVDDGSPDATAAAAGEAGATVVRLGRNQGKGAAVRAGVAARPDADIYLLVDADLRETAGAVGPLLGPVVNGGADMTIAVFPSAGNQAGRGRIKRLAASGITRASGYVPAEPLSGQRAIRGPLLRSLVLAERFGLEVGLTIDVARAGGRILEIPLPLDHRHSGRTLAGVRHRLRQGRDILAALWPRLTTSRKRIALIVASAVVLTALAAFSGASWEAGSVPATRGADRVVVFGMPHVSWEDLEAGRLPNLQRLIDTGAVAASSVRTLSGRPNPAEAYATLGAGARVAADDNGGQAYDATEPYEEGTAAQSLERRTGVRHDGAVAVVGLPAVVRLNARRHLPSAPGALGQALAAAGLRAAVFGNSDTGIPLGNRGPRQRPAAIAVADRDGSVPLGAVGRSVLVDDPRAPFGVRADHAAIRAGIAETDFDVAVVDPGDLNRAAAFEQVATAQAATEARRRALRDTDALLGAVADSIGADTLLLVVATVPPGREWHLAPMVAHGAGVVEGTLHSPSTRRRGLVTLTDVAPTILTALEAEVPDGMIGHALRYVPGEADVDAMRESDRDATYREGTYLRLTITYIVIQALVYIIAIVAFSRGGPPTTGSRRMLELVTLGISAWPVATFIHRGIPDVAELGAGGVVVMLLIDVALVAVARRFRRHPLSPLAWIAGTTVVLLSLDVATGARLQTSSQLGYSPHTAARFTGFGNTTFAVLAATAILAGALHLHHSPRRREALVAVACLFGFVLVIDGWPTLGADVGGILTLVPVFGLTLVALSGRRISWRAVVTVLVVLAVALVAVAGVDLLRPPDSRSHLGRLVAEVGQDGITPFRTTVERKLATNFRTWRSPWTWSILVISLYLVWYLAWARGWSRQLPKGSALRAGAVGVLAAGLLGYAVNDSGVVVAALVFVYLGPFLTLTAMAHDDEVTVTPPPVLTA